MQIPAIIEYNPCVAWLYLQLSSTEFKNPTPTCILLVKTELAVLLPQNTTAIGYDYKVANTICKL